ncbi:hypothetical protein DMA11_22345 [Marinilabiliaceae bacterium JC017]|nr:hypothetical protein DMA11_22345 [Marinilabiliaceae bacterium JC017]
MSLKELNIHDIQILKVIEDAQNDMLDFEIDYPMDNEKDLFERRKLRFYDFLNYRVNEIPFSGLITILENKSLK